MEFGGWIKGNNGILFFILLDSVQVWENGIIPPTEQPDSQLEQQNSDHHIIFLICWVSQLLCIIHQLSVPCHKDEVDSS